MWQWVNPPRPGRLLAQREAGDWIRFVDTQTGEVARCNVALDTLHNLRVEVWKPDANGAPPKMIHAIERTDARAFARGGGVMRRDVWHYVGREHCEALRLGLTIHWSYFSSTPHAFELQPERGFEEVF
ncbi:MAG: hypothetical protein KKH70_20850, partial [Gammaproteobacteria bacterium]|nr:hypothetical protein [Gammaproteobacteria bacterium]